MANITIYGNELYHYGVMGMKWGIRRYQNRDGTLTPEGAARLEKHYKKSKEKVLNDSVKLAKLDKKIMKNEKKFEKADAIASKYRKKAEEMDLSPQAYELFTMKTSNEAGKLYRKNERLIAKRNILAKKAEKFIAAREKEFAKINYDSIPQADIDKGKEYTIYVMSLQSRNSALQMLNNQNELLKKL